LQNPPKHCLLAWQFIKNTCLVPTFRAMQRVLQLPIILLLFLPNSAPAQNIQIPDALSGKFTQIREIREAGLKLRSEGSFSFAKDKGIRWSVEKPIKNTVVLGPDAQIDGGEVAKQIAAVMQGLILQDMGVLSKYFNISRAKRGRVSEIRLKTTDETIARVFSEIIITGEKYVQTVRLSNRQGDMTTISFTDIREYAGDFSRDE